jgi:hypothetical protein
LVTWSSVRAAMTGDAMSATPATRERKETILCDVKVG